ncbi:DUF3040 domain-containing protein [Pseudonocardia sp. Cha107L01]|uniref:DUF3040 domain-containing protein n=1 Tax=Pseudonocardia sp. Cha107L01 TaxID=3457576 RepID=UPI00403E7A84
MLSDRDRVTLEEIQQRLVTEDPQFIEAFDRNARGLTARTLDARKTTLTVMIVIALLLTVLIIVVQAAGPALLFTLAACCLIWLRRAHRAPRPLTGCTRGPGRAELRPTASAHPSPPSSPSSAMKLRAVSAAPQHLRGLIPTHGHRLRGDTVQRAPRRLGQRADATDQRHEVIHRPTRF